MVGRRRSRVPRWVYWSLFPATMLPVLLSLPVALRGAGADPLSGLSGIGGLLGAPLGSWYRDRDYRALDRANRDRIVLAQRSGVPTGDPDLDALALSRLRDTASFERRGRWQLPLLGLILLVLPAVVAIRVNPWWLLVAGPAEVFVALVALATHLRPVQPRLKLLERALAEPELSRD